MNLTLTIPRALWLTSNRPIANHAHKARIVRDLHVLTKAAAREQEAKPLTGPLHAHWTIRYPKGVGWVHGDASNSHPTAKACLDALVEDGLIEGDGPRHIVAETYRRGPNLDVPVLHGVVLTLTPMEET